MVVGFQGSSPKEDSVKKVLKQAEEGSIGGVLMFKENLKTSSEIKTLTQAFRISSEIPLFLAIDQEGGLVQRFGEKYHAPKKVSHMFQEASDAKEYYKTLALELADHGFNLNFAPCVDLDVTHGEPCPVIGKFGRSFSSDPTQVFLYGSAFVEAHRSHGVKTCLKHFPGHGRAFQDTHADLVDVSHTWTEEELKPFELLINHQKADMVMTAHLFHSEWSKEFPATMSSYVVKKLLRTSLHYDGVIVSDDLHMGAIIKNYDFRQSVVQTLMAGVDLLIFSQNKQASKIFESAFFDPDLPRRVIDYVMQAIDHKFLNNEDIERSYARIMRLKT